MTKKTSKKSSDKVAGPLEDFYGFKVLPVIVKEGIRHFMYMTKHQVRSVTDNLPADRTLFLVNLPVDTTDAHLQYLFRSHGKITKIIYHTYGKKRKQKSDDDDNNKDEHSSNALRMILHSGSNAHIVFDKVDTLNSVMEMTRIVRNWTVSETEVDQLQPLGFERHMLKFQLARPDHGELQQKVDSYMLKFKENEYEKERELLQRMNKMDEDGFVVVSRHKKKKNTDGEIHVTAASSIAINAYDINKVKKKELVDFYRFQLREKKQNELFELRKRFEEDKVKIDKLKQARKFRPY
ncbi:SSU rRNA processing protein [Halteromyces radiatus]|uniref:SSU rRNA processing protein n=1 Tax=Halteromyces radiatus TaxID=101107 RepID=UPI00221FAE9D|nr:SSU rRNA processing protein [Halteromyces radiatus]KAI8085019.1 SSU rRNA processing protein [Halteromyces radiatus]